MALFGIPTMQTGRLEHRVEIPQVASLTTSGMARSAV